MTRLTVTMSSGFVSAGGEEIKPRDGLSEYNEDAWERARQKIEELKKPKPDAPGTQEGGKSLYEHLQAQKAAKQEAFEEATKLRNQFRPLDDGEVAFLELVKSRENAKVRAEREETQEELARFRREREAAEEKVRELEATQESSPGGENANAETWTATKKRRRIREDENVPTIKVLRTSTDSQAKPPAGISSKSSDGATANVNEASTHLPSDSKNTTTESQQQKTVVKAPILVSYGSDSDD